MNGIADMDYVNLGRTGLKVSRLCLGCMSYGDPRVRAWELDEASSRPFIRKALEAGINFFDTANAYGGGESERIVGRALKDFARRDEVVIATKVYLPMGSAATLRGLSRKTIFDALDASLGRLGTDYVDLYQIHRYDEETPIEETLEALNDVVRAGKVRYLGASSMPAWRFMKMIGVSERHGWSPFVSMQPLYNLLSRDEEREMLPLCEAEGIGVIPYSPLARGVLARGLAAATDTSRARAEQTGLDSRQRAVLSTVEKIASARGVSNGQIALAWVLANPAITAPIVGATKVQHIDDAVAALRLTLTSDELEALGG